MALSLEFPVVSSNMKAGLSVYGTVDPYDTTKPNNGARNPLGALYYVQPPQLSGQLVGGGPVLASTVGGGSGLWVKYVKYLSTANPAVVAGPAVVYWTDETFTTVSGVFSEGAVGNANGVAGWLLPNTATGAYGIGSSFTATILNGGGNGSYVFIALVGFVPGAISVASTAKGDALIGASGNFTVARVAAQTAPTSIVAGWAQTAISSSVSDIIAAVPLF